MEELLNELKRLGYEGSVSKGAEGYDGKMKNCIHISFPKKGNSELIKDLIISGWKKEREYKIGELGKFIYAGYSMYVDFKKFY